MQIAELLKMPSSPETGQKLVAWVKALPGRIIGGEMMIGLLSADDVALVPAALIRATECGIAEAHLDLGNWLAAPPYGTPDLHGARVAFREAIAKGVSGARLRFAQFLWFYCQDIATAEEKREAYSIVAELAKRETDGAESLYLLGLLTFGGFGIAVDQEGACALQMKAAELGNADAMFEAYLYHETGAGVEKDSAKAMEYLKRAAAKQQPRAMYNLAACLATGRGILKDSAKAAEWYSRASDAGNIRATANLAMMYAKGEGVTKSLEQAKQLFDEAEYMGMDVSKARASVGL